MSDSTCLDTKQTEWMLSSGQTPCQIAQSIVRACSATARVQHLSVDFGCSALGIQSSSPCCCTTVTYAVVSACWVCQTSQDPIQISTTYRSWLAGCPTSLNGLPVAVSSVTPPIPVPGWAVVAPGDVESRWNQSLAQRAAGYTSPSSTNTSTAATSTASILTSSPPPNQDRPPPPYAPIAIGTALALVFLLGMSWWLYRRRNRVAPSLPAADFEIDPSDTLLGGQEHHDDDPKSWGWWTRRLKGGQQKRTSASDPGKIDAWRYPFDYTPVSVDGSGSGSGSGSGRQGYYDPYNPTRPRGRSQSRSDTVPLRGRVSADTLHVPGQLSHHHSSSSLPAAAPGYTPPSPTPGYSPSPRYSTPQPLPQAMYTPSNQYPAAHLQQPAVVSPAGYRTPQGMVTPFPYTQPPSHGTTSLSPSHGPMSPQTYMSPQTPRTTSPQTPRTHRTYQTFELSLSPAQYAEIRNMYPEVRVRKKKRRRRERREAGGSDAENAAGPSGGEPRGRPRSWSTPTGARPQPEPEEEWDGRPRNGVELREKYSRRRESDADAGGNGGRTRARDGGISLMGGPPPKR